MTITQNRSKLLEDRTLNLAVMVISLCKKLPKTQENKILSNQLVRSASSVGANYTEANNASSRVDFRNKIFIAKKEAAETRYWLKLIEKTNSSLDVTGLIDETSQILFILQKIITTLKNGQ